MTRRRAVLALADGLTFEGEAFGAAEDTVGEVVFNTSHTGYQEILTDPSYAGQIVCLTAPEIGNYGVNAADGESARPWAAGVVVREANDTPSSWRAESGLGAWLAEHGVPGLAGIDTRMLVRHIREAGAQMGVLAVGEDLDPAALVARAREAPGLEGRDLANEVSTPEAYTWTDAEPRLAPGSGPSEPPTRLKVVVLDYGVKHTSLRLLREAGCEVEVVPAATAPEDVLARAPDGVFVSNGPGDPAAIEGAGARLSELLGRVPVFGICLGAQLLALSLGGRTYKLKFGHHGGNHPVKDLETGRVVITSENHGFAIDPDSLKPGIRATHRNLNDGTIEGIAAPELDAFAVQFHPEAGPGPHDSRHLFDRFVEAMERRRTPSGA